MSRLLLPLALLAALAAPAAAQTLQARYAAAQAAFDAGQWRAAYDGFREVLPRIKGKPAAVVSARLASAALALNRADEAAPLIEAALPQLDGGERLDALADLGRAREQLVEPEAAAAAYGEALKAAGPTPPLSLRIAQARTLIFADPPRARALFDALLPAAEAEFASAKESYAQLLLLRGRVELADGKPAEARRWFQRALDHAGGLSASRVSLADVRIRGELALASFLLGNPEDAHRYLAFSGAGTLAEEGFTRGADTPLPQCVPGVLEPADMAVVELSLANDGRVAGAQTVYVSRRGEPATAFARAARDWSWPAEAAAKMSPWVRGAVRLELRCTTDRPDGASLASLWPLFAQWSAAHGGRSLDVPASNAAALPLIRAEVARREVIGGAALLMPLMQLGMNGAAPPAESAAARVRARDVAAAANAPDGLRVALEAWALSRPFMPANAGRQRWFATMRANADQLEALLETRHREGRLANRGGAFALTALGSMRIELRETAAATAAFRRVAALPESVVGPADPFRQLALLRLATAEAAAKRPEEAQRLFAATGLSPDQCALVDLKPAARFTGVTAADFPDQARMWNMQGFARVAFDITAEGRVTGQRTVMASPPLAFSAATERAVGRFRYEPVFRPGGGAGCSGQTQTFNFALQAF